MAKKINTNKKSDFGGSIDSYEQYLREVVPGWARAVGFTDSDTCLAKCTGKAPALNKLRSELQKLKK